MTSIKQLLTLLSLTCCLNTVAQTKPVLSKAESASKNIPFRQKDTAYWIDNFRDFRDAVYRRDITKTKAFFTFPVAREGNEIWYRAYEGNEQELSILTDKPKPFTEKDLEQYYGKIFPQAFIKSLLKVKTDELFRKGSFETPAIKDGPQTYILYATYDKAALTLSLNLALKTVYKIADNETQVGEYNIIYEFKISPNGHIKFSHLLLAG